MFVRDASTFAGSFVLRRLGGDASIVGKHYCLAFGQTIISKSKYSPGEKVKYLLVSQDAEGISLSHYFDVWRTIRTGSVTGGCLHCLQMT